MCIKKILFAFFLVLFNDFPKFSLETFTAMNIGIILILLKNNPFKNKYLLGFFIAPRVC